MREKNVEFQRKSVIFFLSVCAQVKSAGRAAGSTRLPAPKSRTGGGGILHFKNFFLSQQKNGRKQKKWTWNSNRKLNTHHSHCF
jgi:hypothetical protein